MCEGELSTVLEAAQQCCIAHGNCTADEVAGESGLDLDAVVAAMTALVRAGKLIGRPGGIYARALVRNVRLPGASYVGGFPASRAAMTAAR